MLASRIAVATTLAVLVAPAAAFAAHGNHGPSATPLLVELAAAGLVLAGLLARRPLAGLARRAWSRLAHSGSSRFRAFRATFAHHSNGTAPD
jgi:hypothetical protein